MASKDLSGSSRRMLNVLIIALVAVMVRHSPSLCNMLCVELGFGRLSRVLLQKCVFCILLRMFACSHDLICILYSIAHVRMIKLDRGMFACGGPLQQRRCGKQQENGRTIRQREDEKWGINSPYQHAASNEAGRYQGKEVCEEKHRLKMHMITTMA